MSSAKDQSTNDFRLRCSACRYRVGSTCLPKFVWPHAKVTIHTFLAHHRETLKHCLRDAATPPGKFIALRIYRAWKLSTELLERQALLCQFWRTIGVQYYISRYKSGLKCLSMPSRVERIRKRENSHHISADRKCKRNLSKAMSMHVSIRSLGTMCN